MAEKNEIKLFEEKKVRTIWDSESESWYFVVSDVVQVLTDTPNPSDYIKKMRKRDSTLSEGWGQIVTPLSVDTAGGRQKLNCANVEARTGKKVVSALNAKTALKGIATPEGK